jgi:hypothetical protein
MGGNKLGADSLDAFTFGRLEPPDGSLEITGEAETGPAPGAP